MTFIWEGRDTGFSLDSMKQKRMGAKNFTQIPNGTGGLQDRLPVLWTAGVNTGRLTKEEFVAATSANIAKILNIYPRKGCIRAGADADLVVWDPAGTKTISVKTQHQKVDFNIFEGMTVRGIATHTLTRGALAWANGDLRAVRGAGQYLKRPPAAAYYDAIRLANARRTPHAVDRATEALSTAK